MVRSRRTLCRLLRWVLFCLCLLLLLPVPARADVGPRPILPGGLTLKPGEQTPIQMAAERVVMNIRPAALADNTAIALNPDAYGFRQGATWYQVVAEVQADFSMHNPRAESLALQTWFPLASTLQHAAWLEINPEEVVPRIEGFQILVNGAHTEVAVSELPNPAGAEFPPLPWASFPVTYTAAADTLIQVNYVLPLSLPAKSRDLVLYYIFQTGAGWAGSIGQAELVINLPYPASPETLSGMPPGSLNAPYFIYSGDQTAPIPSGAVLDGNQARWTWTNFEPGPNADFALLLMHPAVWDGLQADRAAVDRHPDDGPAHLKLCLTYRGLSSRAYHAAVPASYAAAYQPHVEPACQAAARLLPGDAAPHYLLAEYYLSALEKSPSIQNLRPVLVELQLAQALEAFLPSSEVNLCRYWEDLGNAACLSAYIAGAYPRTPAPDWLASVDQEVSERAGQSFAALTATASAAAKTESALGTALARPSDTRKPTKTPTSTPSPLAKQTNTVQPTPNEILTPSPSPSRPANAAPTPTAVQPAAQSGWSRVGLPLLVAGSLAAILYLITRLSRRRRL